MLILTRKKGQSIIIDDNIEIVISMIDGDQVKLGVIAPSHNKVYRKELLEELRSSNKEAVTNLKRFETLKINLADLDE
ncbi:hypothetical protein D3C76_1729170 [compost metagenome]